MKKSFIDMFALYQKVLQWYSYTKFFPKTNAMENIRRVFRIDVVYIVLILLTAVVVSVARYAN
jgi:hypothetical protein